MNMSLEITIYSDVEPEYTLEQRIINAQYEIYNCTSLFEIYKDTECLRQLNEVRMEYLNLLEGNGLPVPESMLKFL